jgi:hypothetical protein
MISRHRIDLALALLLGLASGMAYAWLALPLSRTLYADHINLAFDFDPTFFVRYLTAPMDAQQGINYKHPLWALFRPLAMPFLATGFGAKEAAALAMAVSGGLAAGLAYTYARLARVGVPESIAAALLFAASSCSVFVAVVPESYGWVNLSLPLLWCTYLLASRMSTGALGARLVAGVFVAGVTITNLVQALIAEWALRSRAQPLLRATLQTALVGAAVVAGVAAILVVLQPADFWAVLTRPLQTAKDIYWLRTKGDGVGLAQLLSTFLLFAFFAPEFDRVPLAENIFMLDFRSASYAPVVLLMGALWLVFWLANLVVGLRQRPQRWLVAGLAGTVVLNLLFHLDYQFRGSVFIYASHLHFPIFALGLAAGPWVRTRGGAVRAGYAAVLLALALTAAYASGERVLELISIMQRIELPAEAPELSPKLGTKPTPARAP